MQLVQAPQGQVVAGEIRYAASDGKCYNIVNMPRGQMLRIRGKEISMISRDDDEPEPRIYGGRAA